MTPGALQQRRLEVWTRIVGFRLLRRLTRKSKAWSRTCHTDPSVERMCSCTGGWAIVDGSRSFLKFRGVRLIIAADRPACCLGRPVYIQPTLWARGSVALAP